MRKFVFGVFMDRDEVTFYNHAKKIELIYRKILVKVFEQSITAQDSDHLAQSRSKRYNKKA